MLVLSTLSALTIRKQSVYEVSCKLMKIMCAGWGEQSPWVPGPEPSEPCSPIA